MAEDLRAAVEDVDDEPTLIRWLRLAATRSADEIANTIRSFQLIPPREVLKQTTDDSEFLMNPNILEDCYHYGLTEGIRRSLAMVYETRFGAEMPGYVRFEVDYVSDEDRLLQWLQLALTRSADEVVAAIRPRTW